MQARENKNHDVFFQDFIVMFRFFLWRVFSCYTNNRDCKQKAKPSAPTLPHANHIFYQLHNITLALIIEMKAQDEFSVSFLTILAYYVLITQHGNRYK